MRSRQLKIAQDFGREHQCSQKLGERGKKTRLRELEIEQLSNHRREGLLGCMIHTYLAHRGGKEQG